MKINNNNNSYVYINYNKTYRRFVGEQVIGSSQNLSLIKPIKHTNDNVFTKIFKKESQNLDFYKQLNLKARLDKSNIHLGKFNLYKKKSEWFSDYLANNVASELGLNFNVISKSVYYKNYISDFRVISKHIFMYYIIEETQNSIWIGLIPISSSNKPITIEYLNKIHNIKSIQVGTASDTGYQGILDSFVIYRLNKEDFARYIINNISDPVIIEQYGGLENLSKISDSIFDVFKNTTLKIDEEIKIVGVFNKIEQERFDKQWLDNLKNLKKFDEL